MANKILTGGIGEEITLSDLANETNINLNSYGGSLYEGLSMFDFIKDSEIEVGCIGVCASAATLPLLASSKRWGTPNSRYLIHNPLQMAYGNAQDMQEVSKELLYEQDRALNLYVENLSISKEEIQSLMNAEKVFDAKEALRIGLIKEIRNFNENPLITEGSDVKNIFNQFKMFYDMDEKTNEKILGKMNTLDKLMRELKSFIGIKEKKMVVVQTVEGIEVDFPEVESADLIKVGDKATAGGSAATGEHVMPNGETYVFEAGELIEIKPAMEEEAEVSVEVEALNAEIVNLKDELSKVKNELSEKDSSIAEMKANFEAKENDFKNKAEEIQNKIKEINGTIVENKAEDKTPSENKTNEKKPVSINMDKVKKGVTLR